MDLHSQTYKTTNTGGGPTWGDVAYRVTADARSGDIINIEDATNINHDTEHRLVEVGPRDLVTLLLLKRPYEVVEVITSARVTTEEKRDRGHVKFDGCMTEVRSTILRMTWQRSGAGLALRRQRIQRLRDTVGG